MHLWSYIYAIGAAQALLLAVRLLRQRVNIRGNRVLAVWLLVLVWDLAIKAWYVAAPQPELLPVYGLTRFFPFLYGSFFYLYAYSLTQTRLSWSSSIHLSGFVLALLFNADLFFQSPQQSVQLFHQFATGAAPKRFWYLDLALFIYSISYVLAALAVMRVYRKRLVERESNIDGITLHWLDILAYGQLVIWGIALSQWLLPIPGFNHWFIYLAVVLWIILLGYCALNQGAIIEPRQLDQQEAHASPPRSHDIDKRFPDVNRKLTQVMEQEKLYRKPALNISMLARATGYPEYLVSQVINRLHGLSFREYINHLRIAEAQRCLSDDSETRSILDIAYDCGFTSKSTFNSAFKRIVNITPSMFRERQRDSAMGEGDTSHKPAD